MNYCVPPNATPSEIRHYTRLLGLSGRGPPGSERTAHPAHPHLHDTSHRLREGRSGNGASGSQPVTMRAVSEAEDELGLPLQLRGAAEEGAVSVPSLSISPSVPPPTADQLKGPVRTEPLGLSRYSSDSVLSTVSAAGEAGPPFTRPSDSGPADPSSTRHPGSPPANPQPQSRSSSTGSSGSSQGSGSDGARGRDGKWRQHQQLVPRMSRETVEIGRDAEDRPPPRPTRRRSSHSRHAERARAEGEPIASTGEDKAAHQGEPLVARANPDLDMPRWGRAQSEELGKLRRGDVSPSIEETNA